MLKPPQAEIRKRQAARQRQSAAVRGYDRKWARLALSELIAEPFCAMCGKTYPRKDMVRDHIVPHRGSRRLFNDPANRQTLCRWCHAAKTARGE